MEHCNQERQHSCLKSHEGPKAVSIAECVREVPKTRTGAESLQLRLKQSFMFANENRRTIVLDTKLILSKKKKKTL